MRYLERGKRQKEYTCGKNAGSTLITVLVGVSFMVILACIILTVSFANLRMKQIDYKAKSNFYEDEKGLDDVYNGLGRDISECLTKAYNDTLAQVSAADGTARYTTQTAAYEKFVTLFQVRLEALYGGDGEHRDDTRDLLRDYVTNESALVAEAEVIDYGATVCEKTSGYLSRYVFQDVQVKFTERNGAEATGYESYITTDIVVEVPYISFFQDFSRVLDYSLIGNKGIYFKDGTRTVAGNVYAGTDNKSANADYQGYHYSTGEVYDGMNFYNSNVTFSDNNYIISKGDFNICQSEVSITAPTGRTATAALWAENIRTVENDRPGAQVTANDEPAIESKLTADANMYIADDLELNARRSDVQLKGSYYGYNNNSLLKGYATTQSSNVDSLYSEGASDHARSSSIVLNANNSNLDVTGLDTLVLAGLAYVDIRNPLNSYQELETDSKEADEYQTGESLAIKYNQMLYLAPMDILYVSNPVQGGESLDLNTDVCPPKSSDKSKLTLWFGNSYLNDSQPVKAITYDYSGTKCTYYYLNFKSEADKAAYVQEVMEAEEPAETDDDFAKQRWGLKQNIFNRADDTDIVSNIQIDGTGCKIYTRGVVTDTTDGSVVDNTITKPAVYNDSLNMASHYEYLWKRLDPVETEGIVSNSLTLAELNDDITARGLTEEELPAEYFVALNKITTDKSNTVSGYDVIIRTENGTAAAVISNSVKGIVLSKGDVVINADVEGIVISGGKITVTGDGSIKANRGIVQTILEKEQKELSGIKTDKVTYELLQNYASYYFKQIVIDGILGDNGILGDKSKNTLVNTDNHKYINGEQRVTSTEYTDFMYFKNWRKGE